MREKMLTLIDYLTQHRDFIRPRVLPKQLVQYQDNRAENHALLGDRLLDVYLYSSSQLLDEIVDTTGKQTTARGKIVSDSNLACYGEQFRHTLMDDEEWELLSEKERGTFVEAVVAACFACEARRHTDQFQSLVGEIIAGASTLVSGGPLKNPISLVLEWMQARAIREPQRRFETTTIGEQPAQFFQTTIDIGISGDERSITGSLFNSKDDARQDAAKKALVELGLLEEVSPEIRIVSAQRLAEHNDEELIRDGSFDQQTIEREIWDLDETLAWFRRKAARDAYRAVFLLRAQLNNQIEVAGWVGSLNSQYLTILTAAFGEERFWGMGLSGQSRNQSKKAAGRMLLNEAPFEGWIESLV